MDLMDVFLMDKLYVVIYETPEYEILQFDPPIGRHAGIDITCLVFFGAQQIRAYYQVEDFFRNNPISPDVIMKDCSLSDVDFIAFRNSKYRRVRADVWAQRRAVREKDFIEQLASVGDDLIDMNDDINPDVFVNNPKRAGRYINTTF